MGSGSDRTKGVNWIKSAFFGPCERVFIMFNKSCTSDLVMEDSVDIIESQQLYCSQPSPLKLTLYTIYIMRACVCTCACEAVEEGLAEQTVHTRRHACGVDSGNKLYASYHVHTDPP